MGDKINIIAEDDSNLVSYLLNDSIYYFVADINRFNGIYCHLTGCGRGINDYLLWRRNCLRGTNCDHL